MVPKRHAFGSVLSYRRLPFSRYNAAMYMKVVLGDLLILVFNLRRVYFTFKFIEDKRECDMEVLRLTEQLGFQAKGDVVVGEAKASPACA